MSVLVPTCLLCGALCRTTTSERLFTHPTTQACPIVVTDGMGASLDHLYEMEGEVIFEKEPDPDVIFQLRLFTPVEKAMEAIFDLHKVPRLGGSSGIEGWTSMSTFQRCPYAWARKHLPQYWPPKVATEFDFFDPMGLAVGGLVHAYLACMYQQRIDTTYPISAEGMHDGCLKRSVNPTFLEEAWRLFTSYRVYYKHETLKPVMVETLFVDPETRRSVRTDTLVLETDDNKGHPTGLYVMDHKTAQRFDDTTLTGWHNDGGIIQQADIFRSQWEKHPKFQELGPLQGVIINLIGKQKTPEFYRAFVHPNHFQVDQHRAEMPIWQAHRQMCVATGIFPRARNGCITRYGKCPEWEHCVTGE